MSEQRQDISRVVYVFAVVAAVWAALLFPFSAGAWEVSKSSNGVVLTPSSTDSTGTYDISVRVGYKGGEKYSESYDPALYFSYNYTSSVVGTLTFTYPGTVVVRGIEVPLDDEYRIQRVTVNNVTAGKEDYCFVVVHEPLNVAVVSQPAVVLSGSPTMTLDSTLTVDPWVTVRLPEGWPEFLVVLGVVMCGGATATWLLRRG